MTARRWGACSTPSPATPGAAMMVVDRSLDPIRPAQEFRAV